MNFRDLNLNEWLVEELSKNNFFKLTEIQERAIPKALKDKQIIATAPTGTGKTLSFLIPILNNLIKEVPETSSLIFVPTRELATQIYKLTQTLKGNFSCSLVIGGEDMKSQIKKVNSNPDIIIATPERFIKVLNETNNKFDKVSRIVVDEVDMFIDLGFLKYLEKIIEKIDYKNVSFYSATIPTQLQNFINNNLPGKFEYIDLKKKNSNIEHIKIKVNYKDRLEFVNWLINEKINPYFLIIFTSSIKENQVVYSYLKDKNKDRKIVKIDSGLEPRKRKTELKIINNEKCEILVSTDLLARGMDLIGATHIISFSFPKDLSYYIHRSGRTARHNNTITGKSYILYDESESYKLSKIEKNKNIKFVEYKFNIKNKSYEKINKNKNRIEVDFELQSKINKIINKYKRAKIKPGYKEKMNKEIESLKKYYKKNK